MKLFRFIEDMPLSPWAYILYSLLFCIPVVGLIFVLVFALGSGNQHRKNFARSWVCAFIMIIILSLVFLILHLLGVTGLILKLFA